MVLPPLYSSVIEWLWVEPAGKAVAAPRAMSGSSRQGPGTLSDEPLTPSGLCPSSYVSSRGSRLSSDYQRRTSELNFLSGE